MLSWQIRCLPMKGFVCLSGMNHFGLRHPKCLSLGIIASSKNHYTSLGVTPHATHSDIKTAYYKLSMMYHPDKNKGSDVASEKFRDISAAYEVLGNFKLRRLYDKGILHTAASGAQYSGTAGVEYEDDPTTKFYKARENRTRPPTPTGRTPIYDFDEWSRSHYGASFARREAARKKYERKTSSAALDRKDMQKELFIFGVAFLVLSFFMVSLTNSNDYDVIVKSDDGKSTIPNNLSEK